MLARLPLADFPTPPPLFPLPSSTFLLLPLLLLVKGLPLISIQKVVTLHCLSNLPHNELILLLLLLLLVLVLALVLLLLLIVLLIVLLLRRRTGQAVRHKPCGVKWVRHGYGTGRRRCHNTIDKCNAWLGLVSDLCGTTHDNTTVSSFPATNCAFSKQPRKRCMILGQLRHYTMKSACHCLNDAQQHWADRREGDGEEMKR